MPEAPPSLPLPESPARPLLRAGLPSSSSRFLAILLFLPTSSRLYQRRFFRRQHLPCPPFLVVLDLSLSPYPLGPLFLSFSPALDFFFHRRQYLTRPVLLPLRLSLFFASSRASVPTKRSIVNSRLATNFDRAPGGASSTGTRVDARLLSKSRRFVG